MGELRSSITKKGREMAGARALWRANGMKDEDFNKPIIAIVNSFTQFVPGHVHLHKMGQNVKKMIDKHGGFGAEFNTIAIDDGIAMGHAGMLYSLPSRELIADSVEYMVNAHMADALFCIGNCDKIVPGMLMAAMRLNIPAIFVSGGPMEAGEMSGKKLDLIDAMIAGGQSDLAEAQLLEYEKAACPTCGSCSGLFTANSMNCLMEAMGLALPGNGTLLSTHQKRLELFEEASRIIVDRSKEYYFNGNNNALPRTICNRQFFENAMTLDIAMGGSTNTVLHLLAIAQEAGVEFTMKDIDKISRNTPTLCKVAPSSAYHIEDVHRAGGIMGILAELKKKNLINPEVITISGQLFSEQIDQHDITNSESQSALEFYKAAPGGIKNNVGFSQNSYYDSLDLDRENGCIRSVDNAYSKDGGLCVLYGNIAREGCIVKTAGVDESIWKFEGKARVFHSQESACQALLQDIILPGEVVLIVYEGPKGGPGMQEMLYPTTYLKSKNLGAKCALITDGRFSGGTSGLSIGHVSPEAAEGGEIALVREGDIISIDIPERKIEVKIDDSELEDRRNNMINLKEKAWKPVNRNRPLSKALKIYALTVTSAAKGAFREVPE